MDRALTPAEQRKVRARFIRASMRPAHCPEPTFEGVRWSDDYRYVFVPDNSGLGPCGFHSLFPEHQPVEVRPGGLVYPRLNPGADSLLRAIAAVMGEEITDEAV